MSIQPDEIERLLAPLEHWQRDILRVLMQRMREGRPFESQHYQQSRRNGKSWLRMVAAAAVQFEHQQQRRRNLIEKGRSHLAGVYPDSPVRYVRDFDSFTDSPNPPRNPEK